MVAYGFWKTRPELPSPDFVLAFTPASYAQGKVGDVDTEPGFTLGAWQQRPQSQGHVRIRSREVRVAPSIQPNFLDHAEDRRVTVAALKWARKVFATDPLRQLIAV